jgi:hypothetical protein
MVVHILGCALAVALIDRGWTVSALPGEVVVLSKGEASMMPFADITGMTRKQIAPADWTAVWERLGLLELDLGTLREKVSAAKYLSPPPLTWRPTSG